MLRFPVVRRCLTVLSLLAVTSRLWAAHPAEQLLPATTKAFFSTPDVDGARKAFDKTQLGQMCNDPVMRPFIDDLKSQIGQRLEHAGKRLGLKWEDLEGVYGGEVSYALVQPDPKDKLSHATVIIVDITGKQAEAKKLLTKIDASQIANRATRSAAKAAGVEMTVYTHPPKDGEKVGDKSYYFIRDDQLVVSDNLAVSTAIVGRMAAPAKDSLATVKAFEFAMQRNEKEAGGVRQNVRWFIEPFGYVEVSRALQGGRKKRGTDLLKILQGQGFTAVQGLGGYVFFGAKDIEILHRTFVYAPGPYNLAMRMLDFPNSKASTDLEPPTWVLPDVATYLSFNWQMQHAFNHAETLVDAIAGDKGVFKEIWLSLKTDPNGPKIDIYKGLIDHLGTRANLVSDIEIPVGLKSERLMGLIEVTDPDTVAKTVEQAFKNDPQAKKRVFRNQTIWEITQEEAAVTDASELMIEGAGFVNAEEAAPKKRDSDDEPKLPNMAITVYAGHLVVATHANFVEDLIVRGSRTPNLAQMDDFQRVQASLKTLGANSDSFRFFARTDESYRATFELLKQGKLPEAETMLARILNGLSGPHEEGAARKQELDGSKLPDFELVKKYLGPSGLYAQTEREGWWVVGCLLKKE